MTSRRRLADLEGARTLLLDPLDDAGSLELLGNIVGPARIGAEPRAARSVLTVCAGLPLAIRIAGTRLLERPHWSIGHFARRLTEAPRLLDELFAGDLGVRPSLDADHGGLGGRLRPRPARRRSTRPRCSPRWGPPERVRSPAAGSR